MLYRKKPVVIEAVQWNGRNQNEIKAFCQTALFTGVNNDELTIPTLEGDHLATIGDFIIKGVDGEFYPCKAEIFSKTYERA